MSAAPPPPAPVSPPRRRRRLPVVVYAHPFELAFGVVLIVSAVVTGTPARAEDSLPDYAAAIYHAVSIIGGLGVLLGLRYRAHALGRTIERAACYLVAGVWSAYAVLVFNTFGWAAFRVGATALIVAAACLLRGHAIAITERVILEQLRRANTDPVALRRLVDGRPPDGDGGRP